MKTKPLESDHQHYQVQCCIADPSYHNDPRCRLGVTGRAQLIKVSTAQRPLVWFAPDDDSIKNGTSFPLPLAALLFGSSDIDNMPEFYQRLLEPLRISFEIVKKDPPRQAHTISTAADLASTPWAQRFLKECNDNTLSSSYLEALRRAGEPVEIYHTTETGEPKWAVSLEDGFWMDARDTKEEAEALVAEMNWPKI